jgi:hypothetical protein
MRGKSDTARTPPLSSLPAHPRTSPATAAIGQQRRCEHHHRPRWTHAVCKREGNHTTRRHEYHHRLRWTPGVCRPKENPTTRRRDHHCRLRCIGTHHSPSMRRRAGIRYVPLPPPRNSPSNHPYPARKRRRQADNEHNH